MFDLRPGLAPDLADTSIKADIGRKRYSVVRRRTFSKEFKREAVALTESRGKTVRRIVKVLGMGESLLQHWRR